MAAISTSSRSTWAAKPIVSRLASPPGSRLVAHDRARNAAVRGAAWATPMVRGSRKIDLADCIGLAMVPTLMGGQVPGVDLSVARELAPAVTRHLGQRHQLAPLSGPERLAVPAEHQRGAAGREHGEGDVVRSGVAVGRR